MLLVERWILGHLRHEYFTHWEAAHTAVSALLQLLNARPFQKLPGSRASLWQEERPILRPLPRVAYEEAEWRFATVHRDYHIEIDQRYYSVPYRLVGARVDVRVTASLVECFHDHVRVASHPRLTRDVFHTIPEHMPPAHRAMTLDWNAAYFQRRAADIGPETARLISTILARAVIPEQVFRRCQGILQLAQTVPPETWQTAATRAVETGALSYRAVKAFCATAPAASADRPHPGSHANLRGPDYFQGTPETTPDV